MRLTLLAILAVGTIASAKPADAQAYDSRYPVCLQSYGILEGINCGFTSMAQCKSSTGIRAAQCISNPYYAPTRRAHK